MQALDYANEKAGTPARFCEELFPCEEPCPGMPPPIGEATGIASGRNAGRAHRCTLALAACLGETDPFQYHLFAVANVAHENMSPMIRNVWLDINPRHLDSAFPADRRDLRWLVI
jgi:hypothetical protein